MYEAIAWRVRVIKADLIVAEGHAGRRVAPRLLQLTDWELPEKSPLPHIVAQSRWRPSTHHLRLFSEPTRLMLASTKSEASG